MKTVYDLTRDELNELKQSYYVQLMETDPEVVEEYSLLTTDNIPDDIIFEHYAGTTFTEDDFFCNQKEVE